MLVVNIAPAEFQRRKGEIIAEFEKQFGVLMLIKKETDSQAEMIYSYVPNKAEHEAVWTRVYFIIIFACLYEPNQVETTTPKLIGKLSILMNFERVMDKNKIFIFNVFRTYSHFQFIVNTFFYSCIN